MAKLRQADEALAKGTPIAEVARSMGVPEVTLHSGRADYGAVDRDAIRRLKDLEKANARLKRLVAGGRSLGAAKAQETPENRHRRGWHRAPTHIRSDNGPEFISRALKTWCQESGTDTPYIDPGLPLQDGIVESFNGRLLDELLSSQIVETLAEARYLVDRWRLHYNHRRLQRALGKRTPAAYAAICASAPTRSAHLRCGTAGRGGDDYHR